MEDVIMQFTGQHLAPHGEEDLEKLAGAYRRNQLIRVKAYSVGAEKERSVTQLGLLMACLKVVAENHPTLHHTESVKFACKVGIEYVYRDRVAVRPDGTVVFDVRSFSFAALKHMEANQVFEKAYDWLAGEVGLTVEELVAEAKSQMTRRAQ